MPCPRAWPSTWWWTCSRRRAAAMPRRTSSPPLSASSSRSTKRSNHGGRARVGRPPGPGGGPAGVGAPGARARGRLQLDHAGARRALPPRFRRLSVLLRHLPESSRQARGQARALRGAGELHQARSRCGVLAGDAQYLSLRGRHDRIQAPRRPRHGPGNEPGFPGPQHRARPPPPALHRPDDSQHHRLDVDFRSYLQRDQLDAGEHGSRGQGVLVARQCHPGHGRHHHREYLAWHSLLRHQHPRGPADHLARSLRSGGHRRRQHQPALLVRDHAHHQTHPDHRDDVLGDLHLRGLPDRLRAHPRRARQRHPGLRHLRLRPRHVRRSARHGRSSCAHHAAGPRAPDRRPHPLPPARVMVGAHRLGTRIVRLYIPLAVCMVLMLFPFYWMLITSIKPNRELYSQKVMPLIVHQPTLKHYYDLLSETNFITWTYNTLLVAVVTTVVSLILGTMMAYPLARLKFPGAAVVAIGVAATYLVPQPLLFIPMADFINRLDLGNTLTAVMLTYPTLLIPFSAWLLMGYFKSVPRELEEAARIDGASRWQAMTRVVLPLCTPGLLSAGIFAFTLAQNEFLYALIFLTKSEVRTVPVGAIAELIRGDVFYWGQLMAAALLGSVPVAVIYSFFVDYYVAGLTAGSVKN